MTVREGVSKEACLCLSAPKLGRALCVVSSVSIVLALCLTKFNPRRFQIHPLPYLSDAGIRDPERIVFSFGLALTGALFLPIGLLQYLHMMALSPVPALCVRSRVCIATFKAPTERLSILVFVSTITLSFFLTLFSSIPGLMFFHHIFAFCFAVSAAVWCSCATMFDHARANADATESAPSWNRIRKKYFLSALQIVCWISFGILWVLLKLGWPYSLIPNKDPRFVALALFEYVSTAALIAFIYMTSQDLAAYPARLSIVGLDSLPLSVKGV